MRSKVECVPCFFAQAVRSGRALGLDEGAIRSLVDDLGREISHLDPSLPPPLSAPVLYRRLAAVCGLEDPFARAKERHTDFALSLVPTITSWLERADDRLDAALRIAAAGNVMDLGAMAGVDDVEGTLQRALQSEPERWDLEPLRRALASARQVLVIGDNAGETVFDRVMLEEVRRQWPEVELHYSVRGGPIINDAVEADARAAGLDRVATLVSTGLAVPGIDLAQSAPAFRELFASADVVVSKGQGNYETLNDVDRELFLVLTVKCVVVAEHLGLPRGAVVLHHHRGRPAPG